MAAIPRIKSQRAYEYVEMLQPFRNSSGSLWGELHGNMYVVYSYGYHWPLWVHYNGKWYGNSSKYSTTTSKHHGQSAPRWVGTPVEMAVDDLKTFIREKMR